VINTGLQVGIQAIVRGMHDQIDCEWSDAAVRIAAPDLA
jgi:hypothetical protein